MQIQTSNISGINTRGFIILLLSLLVNSINAQDSQGSKKKIHGNKRIYTGTIISSYTNNPDHTDETKRLFGFNVGFKRTFNLAGTSFETGLEYINHGLSFRSYYFAPGYSKLYDKTFPFMHTLRINELQLPILFKQALGRDTKSRATSYFTLGWAWRYLIYSGTSIESLNDGVQVYDGKTNIFFEYPFPLTRLGSMLQAGLGLQFNNILTQSALFFEVNYKYGISRFHYVGKQNTNNLFIKDANITINMGYKF